MKELKYPELELKNSSQSSVNFEEIDLNQSYKVSFEDYSILMSEKSSDDKLEEKKENFERKSEASTKLDSCLKDPISSEH